MLCTFFISMVPVIELRGALPIGVGMGLSPVTALIVSIIGNMVPVPFILLLIRKIFAWMHRFAFFDKIAGRMEAKAEKAGDKLVKYEMFGLFILVAIPLPGTGAWTGSLVAALFNLRMRNALPVIFAGVVAAGLIVFFITYGVVLLA
ncbi:MAG: small multi-drug export protein [Bacillota bacterium]|nr:small multi-drug export protein [Bacillota bacterium]